MLQKFGKLVNKKQFVRAIMQDSHHNIWISSWFDLFYKYNTDTKKITTYSLSGIMNSQTGIKTITTPLGLNYIYEDNHGIIWLATSNMGLLKYNPEKDDFTVISIGEINKQNSKYSYEIYNIFQDSEDNIWLGTEKGITVFNPYRQNYQTIHYI